MILKHAKADSEIERCFPVMAELRPHLKQEEFLDLVRHLQTEGYHLAYIEQDTEVVCVAGYRISTNLFLGKNLYIDDLVTSERYRSMGHGETMIAQLRSVARENRCLHLHLDSGTQRHGAHKFYFRRGFAVSSFHFDEKLE